MSFVVSESAQEPRQSHDLWDDDELIPLVEHGEAALQYGCTCGCTTTFFGRCIERPSHSSCKNCGRSLNTAQATPLPPQRLNKAVFLHEQTSDDIILLAALAAAA
jgi:hypothetical protein